MIRAMPERKRFFFVDPFPNLDAVSSAMERQQAYLSSLNLKLCVRLLEVHLNDISRVRLHLKA